jgi:hypothetical protein
MPHSENNYTPDVLQRGAILAMTALAIITFTMSNIAALLWQQSDWLVGAVLPAVVIDQTNSERKALDLPALRRNDVLDAAAKLKAEHMAREGYFAHYSPDGVSPWHWFSTAGYSFVHAGENLAVHFTDSDEVVDAWMKSPTHRANIANSNYQEIGVGTARGKYEGFSTVFVVQLFGTPAKPQETLLPIVVTPERATGTRTVAPTERVAGAEVIREGYDREAALAAAVETDLAPVPVEPVTETYLTSDDTVVIMSETISTTTNLAPAEVIPVEPTVQAESSGAAFGVFTSPRTILHYLYLCIGLIAMAALIASVFVEWRIARPRQILYGVGLLLLLSVLFYIHSVVTGGAVIS